MTAAELEALICGTGDEKWTMELLLDAIVPAHGYHDSSETYRSLLAVMLALDTAEKRQFL